MMSDMQTWNGDDPFAPEAVEDSIARSLRADAPATPATKLVRTLADAYALPPAADAVLTRSRASLARRAATLETGGREGAGRRMISTESRPAPAMFSARPPQPPRRPVSRFPAAWRTAAAVLIVALLSAGFYALLRGTPRLGGHPPATPSPTSATATSAVVPPQQPAPAGVYVTASQGLFRLDPSTGAVQQHYPLAEPSLAFAGTPIVANGIIYYTGFVSSRQYDVVAVSATSGAQLWRTPLATQVVMLSLADGRLYGATASSTATGTDIFYALRASDGGVLWTFATANMRGGLPVITGGVVYLANQPQDTLVQHIHALRATDGSQLWDIALPQDCGLASGIAADQGMVFASCGVQYLNGQSGSDIVYGLRASDGSVLWHSSSAGHPSVAAAGGGLVYVSLGGKNAAGAVVTGLDALDETSGAVRWQVANVNGWPVFDGMAIYGEVDNGSYQFSASFSSSLEAISASSGAVLWTYPLRQTRMVELFAPVNAGGVVYVTLGGQVVAISAASGTQLWQSPTLNTQVGVWGLTVVTGG